VIGDVVHADTPDKLRHGQCLPLYVETRLSIGAQI
jgi:hypothetical protein